MAWCRCCLAKMLSGANDFEISDIQEDETEAALPGDQCITMLHWLGGVFARHRLARRPSKCNPPRPVLGEQNPDRLPHKVNNEFCSKIPSARLRGSSRRLSSCRCLKISVKAKYFNSSGAWYRHRPELDWPFERSHDRERSSIVCEHRTHSIKFVKKNTIRAEWMDTVRRVRESISISLRAKTPNHPHGRMRIRAPNGSSIMSMIAIPRSPT
jgi:hypothetical protein